MIIVGIVLLIIGFIAKIPILWSLGILVLIVGSEFRPGVSWRKSLTLRTCKLNRPYL